MINELRKLVHKKLKESYQQDLVDLILDKVAKYGINSLNAHEKSLLDNISSQKKEFNSDNDLIFDYLDFNVGELKGESYVKNSAAKRVSGIKYFNKENHFLFDLEVESEVFGANKNPNTLYVSDEIELMLKINFKITPEQSKEIVKLWFEKQTNIKVSKVDFWITGD